MKFSRAVFLDRDGTINRDLWPEYCTSYLDFEIYPWAAQAIKLLNNLNLKTIVITNQACIGKKLMQPSELLHIHSKMNSILNIGGAKVDAIYYCPHTDNDTCVCRKPKPGMIARAVKEQLVNLEGSYLVGDLEIDILLGKRVGCKTISVGKEGYGADAHLKNLLEAARRIELWEKYYH